MSSATFNEFQRELQKREIPPNEAYIFTMMYERLGQVLAQQDEVAKLLVTFADSLQTFATMAQHDQRTLSALAKKAGMLNRTPGVDVQSVANEPE